MNALPDPNTMRISARSLLTFPQEELWELLTGSFILVFDDGELLSTDREALYSSYVWEFHRRYPSAPLLKAHHVSTVLKGGRTKFGTHLRLIGNALWDTYDHVSIGLDEATKERLRDNLAEMSYEVTNTMYNELLYHCEEYVGSLDITDFVNARLHPPLVEAYDNLEPNEASIEATYKVIDNMLRNDPELASNPLARLYKSDIVSASQVQQCLGPRGFVTDTDSEYFSTPIVRSYTDGLVGLYDTLVASRSAAKALAFSKAPLQDAEYFSRRLQLVTMGVEHLRHGDCGSTRYLRWHVRGPEKRDGKTIYKGDLDYLDGKYYADEHGKLHVVRRHHKHLIGQKLNLRSVLHCQHPERGAICSTCFGDLALSVPANTNIGHMCSTHMTQQSSQSVLSVKHLDGSASVEPIILSDYDKNFVAVGDDGNSFKLASALKGKKVKLVIAAEKAPNITDVYEVPDVNRLPITRVSEMNAIGVIVNNKEDSVEVNQKNRLSSLSHDLLAHIREYGWTTSDDNKYHEIDMDHWDYDKPILILPLKQFNMSDHSKDIAKMLESSVKELRTRDKFVNPSSLLVELFALVNSKLSVSLPVLEVTLYASMVVSAQRFDYSLPKPWTEEGMGVMRKIMECRSVAPAMAFERHADLITSPQNLLLTNRVDHPFDWILMPREVTAASQGLLIDQ